MAGWTDEVWARGVDIRRQIFCNRSLNMKQIKAVGFDMVGACHTFAAAQLLLSHSHA
jgi:hypothetical protein